MAVPILRELALAARTIGEACSLPVPSPRALSEACSVAALVVIEPIEKARPARSLIPFFTERDAAYAF